MGESTVQLISDGGMVVFAIFVLVFGAIALHRRWVVIGWVYTDFQRDHEALKQSERESNEVKREMVTALSALNDEVGQMRQDIRDLRQEVRR